MPSPDSTKSALLATVLIASTCRPASFTYASVVPLVTNTIVFAALSEKPPPAPIPIPVLSPSRSVMASMKFVYIQSVDIYPSLV